MAFTASPDVRTNTSVAAALSVDALMNNLTALTPQFTLVSASAGGATTVVAAQAGQRIYVVRWDLIANAAVNVKWQSHVTPTDLTGLYYLAANGGLSAGFSPIGHFRTLVGEALDINLSSGVAVGGSLTWVSF